MATVERERNTPPPDADEQIAVHNPVSGEQLGQISVSSVAEVKAAVARARAAQPAWEALGAGERVKFLRRWSDMVWERRAEIIRVIRRETGKSENTALAEIIGLDTLVDYYIRHAPRILKAQTRRSVLPFVHRARVHYKAHGVVGIISPWNFPFNLPFMDAIPAIIAGNALIFKPSEITPYSCEIGVAMLHEAGLPRDLVQIVHGDGRTGAALVDEVDYIGFTGSTATGRRVAVRAAERLIPYSLELGGKDPMIVLNDADLDMAATTMLRGAMENAGQVCMSIERGYVEAGIYDKFVERIQHYAAQYRVDSADGAEVHMGSLTNMREVERTERHIEDALSKGARLLHGGQRRPDLGPLFFEPSILVDVDHSMDVMREETFGPVLPIMKVADVDEALSLANDSEYGLAASVFTKDLQRGEAVARRIDSGDVTVNTTQVVVGTPSLPSGGQRDSGVGRRNGSEGLLRYVSSQSMILNNGLGQQPVLSLLDERTLRILSILRRVRRVLPFI